MRFKTINTSIINKWRYYLKCKNCGEEFFEKYSKWSNGDFCCLRCSHSFIGKQDNGTKIVKCITCKKEIEVSKRASPKQCKCDDCRSFIKKPNEKICLNCGTRRDNKWRGKFCCQDCQHEYQYKKYIERWKDGKEDGMSGNDQISKIIKRYLREKYKNKCVCCGWNKINDYTKKIPLEVEHIDGNYKNNKEENLTLLCPNCHSLTSTYRGANRGYGREYRYKLK